MVVAASLFGEQAGKHGAPMDQQSLQAVAVAISSIEAAERRLETAILRTPTGGERNALTDANIHLGTSRQLLHVLSHGGTPSVELPATSETMRKQGTWL